MRLPFKKILFKIIKITGIAIGSVLLLMFLLPVLFPDFIATKIKAWTNSAITTELNFSKARLSFFNHFPSLTLTLYDVSLKGSAPFEKDTLMAADEIALGVDLSSVFSERIRIDEIYLTNGDIKIKVDATGEPNYNVYRNDTVQTTASNDSSSAQLKIERIQIEQSDLVYDDHSIPMLITANDLSYTGKGDLSKAIFDLYSKMQINSFNLEYGNMHYVSSKQLEAELITKINTSSLAFVFEKNDLHINKLPVQFKGIFEFLRNGYNMDFRLFSHNINLHDVFTALPPEYLPWLEKTKVKGNANMDAYLTGKYITGQNIMPGLGFTLEIRDGYIAYENAPVPISNLFLNFDTKLPSLNTDSLYVNIDSIFFNIDKDYFSSVIKLKNLNAPHLQTKLNANLDLEKWNKALGVSLFDLKGKCDIHFNAEGRYATTVVKSGVRQVDTIITSIPKFNLQSSFTNGYFKYAFLPQPINNINFTINASCSDSNYHHAKFAIENINATALNNYIKGFIKISGAENLPVDANLKTSINLNEIKQFYPLDSMDIKGNLAIDVRCKGKYHPDKKLFPVTKATFNLNDGSVQTKYYPRPLEKINANAVVTSTAGTLKDLQVSMQPVSFQFEGQPFFLKMDLKNFENIHYNIASNGIIDIGKIYRVFAINGYNAKGFIEADIAFRGSQSDAVAGRYNKLFSTGTLKVRDVALTTDLYPQPFFISTGIFRFQQDKMWFDAFKANYGKTNLSLKGHLSNVINYALTINEPLKGNFSLSTPYFFADEFMAYSNRADTSDNTTSASGVALIPPNLSLTLNAFANKVNYNGLDLKDFKGELVIDSSKLKLNQTGFSIIDAPVVMDATYQSLSPAKAYFSYHINAQNFDVRKAYNEIKLFHDLAPSAASAQGIVSLDYNLSGKLDESMQPVFPSLKGGGVLSVQKVKMKGFKLINAVSGATDRADIKDPDLSKVNIKTTIANNIITLERVKLRVAGFRPRFEGQMSFDGRLNLSGRLGLPPFGILGIPFTVTGTQESPKVKLRRSKETDKIEETTEEPDEDDDDVGQ